MATSEYRLYRGRGGLANVDFSTPAGTAGADAAEVTLEGSALAPLARYTYVLRPARTGAAGQWLETPDFSCVLEIETDAAGHAIAGRPRGLGSIWAQARAAGLWAWWQYQTPYGASKPAGFAVYSGPASDAVTMLQLWQPYAGDGLCCAAIDLPPGTHWLAVTVCGEDSAESFSSPPSGPYVITNAAAGQLTVLLEETK
ncbi:MAG: hypothetical protein LLG01_02810 [Planctomycetaceae bacterium]|nr:hypothetical protein [Planctomycetaceae bacterium]